MAWLWTNTPSTQLNVRFVHGIKNGISYVMYRWGVRSGILKKNELGMGVDDIFTIIVDKWNKMHKGHAGVSTMVHRERNLQISTTVQ